MFSCDYCILKFETQQEFNSHIKTCNAKKLSCVPLPSCEHCLIQLKTVAELVVHSQTCHMRNNRYTKVLPECVSCLQQFQSLEALNVHILQCTKRYGNYECPECGDLFWTRHELERHFGFYCRKEKRRSKWQ